MDCLPLKYRISSEHNVERTLFVRVYKLIEDEEKTDRILEILNIPFFVNANDLKTLFKHEVEIIIQNHKTTEKLKSKTALAEFVSKKELKSELRLIKFSDESEQLVLYKNKDDMKMVLTNNCGKNLISKRFVKYIEDIDETRAQVMEIMKNYNDEILVAQRKKKRRYEREDDGWVKVVRK